MNVSRMNEFINADTDADKDTEVSDLICSFCSGAPLHVALSLSHTCIIQMQNLMVNVSVLYQRYRYIQFSSGNHFCSCYGAQNDYMGLNFPITQDICYTRLSGRNYFV